MPGRPSWRARSQCRCRRHASPREGHESWAEPAHSGTAGQGPPKRLSSQSVSQVKSSERLKRVADSPIPIPVTKRMTMYSAILTLPACSAPPTTEKVAPSRMALRRPSQSAVLVHDSAPRSPPAWKSPLMAPSRSAALRRVSRAK